MVLEKGGEDQLDRSCVKLRSIAQSQEGEEYSTYSKSRKANRFGHIFCRNCLLKHVIEGKMKETRRGGIRKQLLDGLKETRVYWKLKEGALDALCRELALEEAMVLL